ncbi:DUF2012 domain-containing protein [Mycena kentingensis (nom. inval.)]|nr:DUF2012 domain-containing protein [Mycena kentingensis (nom. inval.)]
MRSPQTPAAPKPSLLPTPRRPSFSAGPSSPTNTSSSGFRALRSLLPFGPNKHAPPVSPSASALSNSNGSRFASFSVVRKSMQRDRSFSASASATDLPVMVIDQTSSEENMPARKSISLHEKPSVPSLNLPESSSSDTIPFPKEPIHQSPVPPRSQTYRTPSPTAELSIIIEADTSGISKHLPSASPSPSPSSTSPSPPSLPQHSLSAEDDLDLSALDLSTSHLDAQVKDALQAQSSSAKKWLDVEPSPEPADVSFNLGALDPELAALLSPHRIVSSDAIKPKSSLDFGNGAPGLIPQHQSSRPRLRAIQRPTTADSIPSVRRSPSGSPSTTHSTAVRRPSPISVSQPPSPIPPPSPLSNSSPVNASTPAIRRTQPHTLRLNIYPTSDRPPSNAGAHAPVGHLDIYRPSTSASLSRGSLDMARQRPSTDTIRRSNTSTEPEPRETSAAWSLKLRRARKRSMSVDERTSPTNSRDASPQPGSSRPGSSMAGRTEWLGPRTAKAFRAAGLLGPPDMGDGDSNDGLSPPSDAGRSGRFRFGSVRSPSSVGRPDSRMAMSPGFGSTSARRRGSGSGSYFGSAGSQLVESPTLTFSSRDTPRSASTAPTSVSGASWERDRDEIRELKEKHAEATGALLSALSDSQRTTKLLREENAELRQRLARLETDSERIAQIERENQALREFVSELREEAGQLKLELRLAAPPAPVASTSRHVPQPFRFVAPDHDVERDSFHAPSSSRVRQKRLSTSSSNFGAPPSNMSLLLNEDGANSSDFDDRSMSVMASPTMVLGRVLGPGPGPGRDREQPSPSRVHRANQSIVSVGSMTTTSPNTSMGSPRSLLLRACDEHHLEDLENDSLSLDLAHEEWPE